MLRLICGLAACAGIFALTPAPSSAQDYSTIGSQRAVFQSQMRHVYGKKTYDKAVRDHRANRQTKPKAAPKRARTAKAGLGYSPDARLNAEVLDDMIERLRVNNPAAADLLKSESAKHDLFSVYANMAKAYGLNPHDVGDTFTAYQVLNWLIAHQVMEPERRALPAARRKIASWVGSIPGIENAQTRQKMSAEMQIQFVALHSGWQNSLMQGPSSPAAKQYADTIAEKWQQRFGQDLRQLSLTSAGFTAK